MKDYLELHRNLRDEIIKSIHIEVKRIQDEFDVENISDIMNAPVFIGYIEEYIDDGLDNSELALIKVALIDIFDDDECAGFVCLDYCMDIEPYSLREFTTDSLISIHDALRRV